MKSLLRAVWVAVTCAGMAVAAVGQAATPAQAKLPADQRAFAAARAQMDPSARLAAMRQFVKEYPKSTRVDRAQSAIFDVLLKSFPERTAEIDKQAKSIVKRSGKGFLKWYSEADVADRLANGGAQGVDLPLAEKLGTSCIRDFTEAAFDKEQLPSAMKDKAPPGKVEEMHRRFAEFRGYSLAALADVDLKQGKVEAAQALLKEANDLDPNLDEVHSLLGQIALRHGNNADALVEFEKAMLLGELLPPQRLKMMELYRAANGGSADGFDAAMDAQYATLFPAPITAVKAAPVTGGHTVLLELFTGSACPPCVSADLAVEGLLERYPATELVALSFDQHIPEPDPLANPDSVARAQFYSIAGTPTMKIDGQDAGAGGGGRADAGTMYEGLMKKVDAAVSHESGVRMELTATRGPNGEVQAHVTITTGTVAQLQGPPEAPKSADATTPAKTGPEKPADAKAAPPAVPPAPVEPQLVANLALVEDGIRYSGQNGVRFHRMVVRSIAKAADSGLALGPSSTEAFSTTFDPAEISRKLSAYLDGYEVNNDRFGKVEFISKDTAMQAKHLGVAAWVEDIATHRVLNAAYVPLDTVAQ